MFVNGRAIESNLITGAVREGYHTALMKGQYPVTFLFVELDPGAVDVNVHPAKREVRFRDPNGVREAVVRCIQQTLEHARANWQEKFSAPIRPGPATADSVKATPDLTLRSEVTAPEVTHRELPHLGAVVGVADPGRAPPEIVGQAHRLPERRLIRQPMRLPYNHSSALQNLLSSNSRSSGYSASCMS